MQVHNKASFAVIAFGWHREHGIGEDVHIPTGATGEINGPYLGEMDSGACHIALMGKITVHEEPDGGGGFHIELGHHVFLEEQGESRGVSVRHHLEPNAMVPE